MALGLLDVCSALQQVLAARLVAVVLLLVLPGTCLLAAVQVRLRSGLTQWAAALGTSTAVLMAWGALGAPLASLGVPRPLDRLPVLIMVNAVTVVAAAVAARDRDPLLEGLPTPEALGSGAVLVTVAAAATVLAGAAGVEYLDNRGSNVGVQVAFGLVAVTLGLGAWKAWRGDAGLSHLCLVSAGTALLWVYSLRGTRLFGYDIQQEYQRFGYVFALARWTPPSNGDPYASMLSITALPAAIAHTTGVSGLYLFKGLLPLFLALVPSLVVEVAARWIRRGPAYVGGLYLVVLPQFGGQLTGISRQEIGFFYFGLLLVLLVDGTLGRVRRQLCLLACLAALVVSHYSTSYVAVLVLTLGWAAFGLIRVLRWMGERARGRPRRVRAPVLVSLLTVVCGIGFVLGWDGAVTNSGGNVTHFATSVIEQGPDFLPNARGGSFLTRWLAGNAPSFQTPAQYYASAEASARTTMRWLDPYPVTVTDRFPAEATPTYPALHGLAPSSSALVGNAVTAASELFLLLIVAGAVLVVVRRRWSGVPAEVAVLSSVFLAFVAYVRVSGSAASFYNIDRAQFQAAMLLAIGLALLVDLLAKHLRGVVVVGVAALSVAMYAGSTGESAVVTGGDPVTMIDTGPGYDQFVISGQEVAAAAWLIDVAGSRPLLYTDEFGMLRIWDATPYAPLPQQLLTPATIDRGGWVYATQYNAEGRAYGNQGGQVSYRFPAAFLRTVKDVVYTSPESAVYR